MIIKLSDAFKLQMGKTPSRGISQYWGGAFPWISIADINDEKYISKTKECITSKGIHDSGIKIVPKNTVIMSFKLSIGKTAITYEDMYTNEAIMSFIDKKIYKIDTEYFYYTLSSLNWNNIGNRAVMGKTINKSILSDIKIPLPDIEKQQNIANLFSKLDLLINKRKQQLSKLDQLVKSRFIEMFGDPVKNPLEWDTKPFLSMGCCKNGINFHTGDQGIKIHCLGVSDFKDNAIIKNTEQLPTISLSETPPEESMLHNGDIVFVRSNGNKHLVGRCLVIYPHNTPTTYSGFCIRYRLTSKEIHTIYLLYTLKTDSMRMKISGRGANIQNLNQQILGTLNIPIPTIELQEQFAAFVQQVDKSKSSIKQSLEKLETLKKSLMQEYFG